MGKLTRATHEYNLSLWTGRINERRLSGLTVAKWCEQNNLGVKTYYYWLRKIKREAFENLSEGFEKNTLALTGSNLPVFSKIDFAADPPLESGASVTIRLNDISIELQDGATESVIRNALLAIRSVC